MGYLIQSGSVSGGLMKPPTVAGTTVTSVVMTNPAVAWWYFSDCTVSGSYTASNYAGLKIGGYSPTDVADESMPNSVQLVYDDLPVAEGATWLITADNTTGVSPALTVGQTGLVEGVPPVSVVSIESWGGTEINITFSGDVSFIDVEAACGTLTVGGRTFDSQAGGTGNSIDILMSGSISVGNAWTWTNDSGVASPPIDLPDSGLVV